MVADFVIKFHLLNRLQDKEAFQILLVGSHCTPTTHESNMHMIAGITEVWQNLYLYLIGDHLSTIAKVSRSIMIMERHLQN